MLYNISINQKAIIDNNWDLSITDAIVFDALHKIFTDFEDLQKKHFEDRYWYFVRYNLLRKELPLLSHHQDNWFRVAIKKLSICGLIDTHPDNQKLGKTFFCLGKNAHKIFSFRGKNNEENRPSNPMDDPKPSIQSDGRPPLNPMDDLPPIRLTDNSTIHNDTIDNNEKDIPQKTPIKKEKKTQDATPEKLPDLSKSNLFRQPVIPTIEKVKEYFKGAGGSESAAQQFFDSHSGTGWFYRGSPIQNFTFLANSYIATINKNQTNNGRTAINQQGYGSYQKKKWQQCSILRRKNYHP